ncbi:GrpB family protein [Paenibacillus glycinis]|uniref:GrpB family protein n=1 Tax=Paenibacillus glycinis TaxID=2697035 RepID=A0ABW9XYS5_9BACL|nr:GrpB family protein [Paenibacillus glycinis]NBD27372.1 GrpB family protein [Paenibacillus glycinis]
MSLDEEITICNPCSEWSDWYADEASSLRSVFGPDVVIEHFGSTSVPGLAAKPIVDILVGISAFPHIPASQSEQLAKLGYECLGTAGVPGRIHLRKRGVRSFNLAITQFKSDLWNDNLILRDYLRENPIEASHYAEHKLRACEKGFRTLLAYSDYKSEFILNLLHRAKNMTGN